VIVEHNPTLYEGQGYGGRIAQAMKRASRGSLLYARCWTDTWKQRPELAVPRSSFYDMQRELELRQGRSISEKMASQTTWEAFS